MRCGFHPEIDLVKRKSKRKIRGEIREIWACPKCDMLRELNKIARGV